MTASHMSRRPLGLLRAHPRLAMAALATGIAVLGLTGCSAGQITQTASQVAPVPGADADAGDIALRNLLIQFKPEGYPAGSDAPLVVRIFNNGPEPVTLTGVSTDGAASVDLVGTPEVVTPTSTPSVPPEIASPSPDASATASPSPEGSPTASPTESPSPTATPTTRAPQPISITIPAQSYVLLVPGEGDTGHLVLSGLTKAIAPGESITVTFTFDDGTEAVVPIPLAPPIDAVPRATPVVEPGGHGD